MGLLQPFFFIISSVVSGIFCNEQRNEVCYPKVGCFSNSYPWTSGSRIAFLPFAPEKVCQSVIFYSKVLQNVRFTVFPEVEAALFANFNKDIPTYFITHGFTSTGSDLYLQVMAELFLKHGPANVYIIGKKIILEVFII